MSFYLSTILTVIHLIAFFGLASFAIYDVTKIITAYVQENRVTSVKKMSTNEFYPYLGKSTICLAYEKSALFPDRNLKHDDYYEMLNKSWNGENINWISNLSKSEQNVAKSLFDLRLYDAVSQMDQFGLDTNRWDSETQAIERLMSNRSTLFSFFDKFITDSDSIKVLNNSWRDAQAMLFRRRGGGDDKIILRSVSFHKTCMEVPLSHFLTVNQGVEYYTFDFVHSMNKTADLAETDTAKISISFGKEIFPILGGAYNSVKQITIQVTNVAIVDSIQFPPCTQQFDTEDECIFDLTSRAVSEICGCTQFSRIMRKVFSGNGDTNYGQQKLCTAEIYEKCWEKADRHAKRLKELALVKGTCSPCMSIRNTFSLSANSQPLSIASDWTPWYPRALVKVLCTGDNSYLLFQEKVQFTWEQFLSQIGGDFGLYIGFSMMSLLQLLAFPNYAHQRRRTAKSNVQWSKIVLEYFFTRRSPEHFFDGHMPQTEKPQCEEMQTYEHSSDFEQRLSRLEAATKEKISSIEERQSRLEEAVKNAVARI